MAEWFHDDEPAEPLYAELGLDAATAKAMLCAQQNDCNYCVVEIIEDRSLALAHGADGPAHTVHYQAARFHDAMKLAAGYRSFAAATGYDTTLTPIRVAYPDGRVEAFMASVAEQWRAGLALGERDGPF